MIRVLCFGDSLTYGQVPGTSGAQTERYDEDVRWTGLLQKKFGADSVVIEEGLPSRTIALDDPRPGKDGRNGSAYFGPCLESHLPLDVVVVWLGTNNTKDLFSETPEQTTRSMKELLLSAKELLRQRGSDAQVVLVAPPDIDDSNEIAASMYAQAPPKLEKLASLYESLADELGIEFINLFRQLPAPKTTDGIHLSEEQNAQVADIIYGKLKALLT